jgi:predicted transcriptional regulator YdeE
MMESHLDWLAEQLTLWYLIIRDSVPIILALATTNNTNTSSSIMVVGTSKKFRIAPANFTVITTEKMAYNKFEVQTVSFSESIVSGEYIKIYEVPAS